MLYKNAFDMWFAERPASCLALATTGVGHEDNVIGIWVQEPGKVPESRMVAGQDIRPSKEYHNIPQELYEAEAVGATEVVKWLKGYLDTHTVFSYNMSFLRKFLKRMDPARQFPEVDGIVDISALYLWINMRHCFPDDESISLSYILDEQAHWITKKMPPIRQILTELCPGFSVPEASIVPSSMCFWQCELLKCLGEMEVPVLVSVQGGGQPVVVPTAPVFPSIPKL